VKTVSNLEHFLDSNTKTHLLADFNHICKFQNFGSRRKHNQQVSIYSYVAPG